MKFTQKLVLVMLKLLNLFTILVVPFYMLYTRLFIGTTSKAVIDFIIAFSLLVVFIIFIKYVKAWYKRKLQAIMTVEEGGGVPSTGIFLVRFLKTIEWMLPIGILSFFLKAISSIEISLQMSTYIIFFDILSVLGIGFLIMLTHDVFRRYFIISNQNNRMEQEQHSQALRTAQELKKYM